MTVMASNKRQRRSSGGISGCRGFRCAVEDADQHEQRGFEHACPTMSTHAAVVVAASAGAPNSTIMKPSGLTVPNASTVSDVLAQCSQPTRETREEPHGEHAGRQIGPSRISERNERRDTRRL